MINDYESETAAYYGSDYIQEKDLDQDAQKLLYFIGKNEQEDVGINNILSKSNIKICKNGDIKIFVNNNTGILINNQTKEIQFFGNVTINGKQVMPNE